ncbi:hypothetical protein CANINC_003886 [Pichia inconspicua]|uniref:inositol phosphorylceramide mannosyltransferase n=1 Tax=Pichia inconspicua TaxID=52247 RepID=A0A4T0WXD5_9ASCO|nr:hypothetical protein CANINC_003886 [[Candida] inconspicua]
MVKLNSELKFVLYAHIFIALFLVYQLFDLITLLYDDSFNFALSNNQLNNQTFYSSNDQLIPKIIHQTYKSNNIPNHWKNGQFQCQSLNNDYQYILWTDEMARDFIVQNYPWFTKTFDSYKFNIERADVIRYFILYHYGGIYIDLDDTCLRNLDPLLNYPAFVRKTIPTGISNDVLGAIPNHPFYNKVIKNLKHYNRNWLVPYITVMFSTGPLFLSVMWKQYIRWGVDPNFDIKILMPNDYKSGENSFFEIEKGSSWHNDDAHILLLMRDHIIITVIFFTFVGFSIVFTEYLIVCLINKKFGSKLSSFYNSLFQKNNSSLNYSNRIIRKSRKDSNLPLALSVDLEKNVKILDDIEEL